MAVPAVDSKAAAARYESVIQSPVRTDQDRRMDASRHPAEFLAFTQVQSGMRVLDVSAGAGYTSQVLALAVGPAGTVWAQTPRPSPALMKRLEDHPQANLIVVTRPFDDPVPEQMRIPAQSSGPAQGVVEPSEDSDGQVRASLCQAAMAPERLNCNIHEGGLEGAWY